MSSMINEERKAAIKAMLANSAAQAVVGHNAPAEQVEVTTTVTVPFYGDKIVATLLDGEYMIPVKPIAERLGLDWPSQLKRLKRDYILNSSMVILTMECFSGVERDQVCIPLKFIAGWLFGIDDDRVSPELQDAIRKYKREMYEVMHSYLVDGYAINPRMLRSLPKHDPSFVGEKYRGSLKMNDLAMSIVCEAADRVHVDDKIEFLSKAFSILNDIYPNGCQDLSSPADKQELTLLVMRTGFALDIVRLSALCRLTETGARYMLQKIREDYVILPKYGTPRRTYALSEE